MRDRILEVLMKAGKPIYLAQLSEKLNERPQLTQYHLNNLVQQGIVVTYIKERKRYYALQPIHYKFPADSLHKFMIPLIREIACEIDFEESDIEETKVLINNLIYMLENYTAELQNVIDEENHNTLLD